MAKIKESTIHVRVTEDLVAKLRKLAEENDLTVSLIVRLLLEKSLKAGGKVAPI